MTSLGCQNDARVSKLCFGLSCRARQRYPDSLAEAMMGVLSGGGPLGGMHHLGALSEHVAAMRRAWGSAPLPGRLPAHLMYSDRDFDENDYEMLLALDDGVASRRGTIFLLV